MKGYLDSFSDLRTTSLQTPAPATKAANWVTKMGLADLSLIANVDTNDQVDKMSAQKY